MMPVLTKFASLLTIFGKKYRVIKKITGYAELSLFYNHKRALPDHLCPDLLISQWLWNATNMPLTKGKRKSLGL
jgi:hypothetical protein